MKIKISIKAEIVKQVRKVARERGTTMERLVREFLEGFVPQYVNPEQLQRNLEALEQSFESLGSQSGARAWRREDLYDRKS
jgi:phosphopantothenate synthetase